MARPSPTPSPEPALAPEIRALAEQGVPRRYAKDAVILSEGDIGDGLHVLLRGRVRVYSTDESGREITYGEIAAGDYFGEMSLDGGLRSASVMALEPCQCSVVPRDAVRAQLARDPALAMNLITQIIRRARQATEAARSMALLDVYRRLARHLESVQGPARAGETVTLTGVTHQTLAAHIGASREMVSRILKDLERGGYVTLGHRRVTLLRKLPARW